VLFWDTLADELASLDDAGLRRTPPRLFGPQGLNVEIDGRRLVNLSSNDYLGLAADDALKEAVLAAVGEHGVGSGASRLIAGNLAPHRELEAEVAAWLGREAALLFSTGYQANVGLIAGLVGREDIVFSDALNHASIIDGCRLSRAQVHVYRHADMPHLASLMEAHDGRRKLIVTESVFSMDGDTAPLTELRRLADLHGAALIVDDAHALGVLGPNGTGLGASADLLVGTFSKAFGAAGGFVAGRQLAIDLLISRARPFVFSTAPAVPTVAAARAGLREGIRRAHARALLARIAEWFHVELIHRGFHNLGSVPSHIVPLRVAGGQPASALGAAAALAERGFFVHAIRPPTVPVGTARLRLSLNATADEAVLKPLLAALDDLRHWFT
jgi:8-amino-7-oxononanoate synthase